MPSSLRWLGFIVLWAVNLMSGIFSIGREFASLYTQSAQPRTVFSLCLWLAFFVSSYILWFIEHQARKDEEQKNTESPELHLALKPPAFDIPGSSGMPHTNRVLVLENTSAGMDACNIQVGKIVLNEQTGTSATFAEIPLVRRQHRAVPVYRRSASSLSKQL